MKNIREKILIIRLSSIGDIMLATPFIRQTRNRFPDAEIGFVIKKKFSSLLSENPHIDYLYELKPGRLKELIREINPLRYDYVFDLHNNIRSGIIGYRLKKNYINHIRKDKLRQQKLVRFKINSYKNNKPIPERYLEVGKPVGVKDDKQGLEYYWNSDAEQKVNGILEKIPKHRKNILIGIAPGAGFYTKRWPVEYFINLINKLEHKYNSWFIILGDRSDVNLGKAIASNRKKTLDLTGQLSLMETGALISNLNLTITNDSGLMHMATAVKTTVIAIFGSSVREFGFFPFRGESRVIENLEAECRPCSHIGRTACPLGHFKCMRELSPDKVFTAVEKYLKELQKA